ncbi:dual specificity protein phosphatase MPK-4-like [Bombyx mandarina]|uniref:Dual specificity protein phosphatase MPK-4-like n=1 Tax=Bombyx mandarina TaxID=7092 RepID=A0A6J2JK32_BOMMA|nr:dual specificity protein phosphatase MPK-4-like [Bombyx mandarina]
MAKQVAEVEIHASDSQETLVDDNLEVSVDLIDKNLYLGNLACAHSQTTIQTLGITHILTVDLVPLPRIILERPHLIFRYVKLADVPKEDLISHLPTTNNYISEAIDSGGTILVHCYFGVSRSAAVVIAYIMKKYGLCYEEAFSLVKNKRRFIGPNVGFVAQLKLYGHMGCAINKDDPRYKQFRLKMAGQKLKQVKILPQVFWELVKPDPGVVRERPSPHVYRCVRCRRVLAAHNNLIPHLPRPLKLQLAKKGIRPPPSKLTGLTCVENGEILIQKLKSLACQILESDEQADGGHGGDEMEGSNQELLDGYNEQNLVDGSIVPRECETICRQMWFVEPMAWMSDVTHQPSGKLHCPNCKNKIGSFSWVMGCKCPCGQKVAPAFYLVPSKVERSNIVQNVQTTV